MDLVGEAKAAQSVDERLEAERRERRTLRGMSRRAEAAIDKQLDRVAKLEGLVRQNVPWNTEPPEFGRKRGVRALPSYSPKTPKYSARLMRYETPASP